MKNRRGPLVVGSISLCFLLGCEGAPEVQTVMVDSADVVIAVNPPVQDAVDRIRLASEPRVVLGGLREDLEQEFLGGSGYPTALRLSDGRIVTHDGTRVMLYGPEGQFTGSIGGPGDGPGEFRDIRGLCAFSGDTILVSDARRRVSLIVPEEGVVRDFVPPGWVVPNTCFSDGAVMARSGANPAERGMTDFVLVSSAGAVVGVLPPLPSSVYRPVKREVSYAIHGEHIFVGSAREMAVTVYSRDGELRRIVRTEDQPTVMSSEEIEAGAPAAGTGRAATRSAPAGATRPMYEKMAVDGAGRVWLLTSTIRGGHERWVVFDSNGQLTGSLRLIEDPGSIPPKTEPWFGPRIVRFGADEVVLMDRDEFGATRLSFYELTGL